MRWLLLAAAWLFGCNSFDGDTVREKQASWRALGIQDYAFVWFEGCFCGIPDINGVRVEVRGGVPGHGMGVSTGLPLPGSELTIDDIFARVLDFGADDPDESSIQYDARHHFIAKFSGDPESNTEDDSLTLEVRCFSEDVDNGCPVASLTRDECVEKGGTPTSSAASNRAPCAAQWPGPSGRISDTNDEICCIRKN